jgi:predicted transcriptional regulator
MPRHEEVRSDQTTTGADQALDERRGDPERRVRHHFEGTARETEIGRVGANDRHVALIELVPQLALREMTTAYERVRYGEEPDIDERAERAARDAEALVTALLNTR